MGICFSCSLFMFKILVGSQEDKMDDDPLHLLSFVCKMKTGYLDDKQRREERDSFVDQWIKNQRLEKQPVNRESFAAFLKLELRDFENSDLHSQLINAFCKREEKALGSNGNPRPSTTKKRWNRRPRQRDLVGNLRAGPPRRPSTAEPIPEAM